MQNYLSSLILLLFVSTSIMGQITLTHNVGTTLVPTDLTSCEQDESWGRIFKLSDFGVGPGEQFIIRSGEIGLSTSNSGARLFLQVYRFLDYPPQGTNTLRPRALLGSMGFGRAPVINSDPQIIQTVYEEPIVVPANVDSILVSVHKLEDFYNPESAIIIPAATEKDSGDSWYNGCEIPDYLWTNTKEIFGEDKNTNFYINVTGEAVNTKSSGTSTRLSHNVCDDVVETDIHSCSTTYIYWARTFTLEDFGISDDEEYSIHSGQIGITKSGWTADLTFNIYEIDENFPDSFSESQLIGSSQTERLQPDIGRQPQIIQIDFKSPVVIPPKVKRILVEVKKGVIPGSDGLAFIAGSSQDNGISWQKNCQRNGIRDQYISTIEMGIPDANFYINVTGNVAPVNKRFSMNTTNICSEFLKEFSVSDMDQVAAIDWDFGDPDSGTNNTSSDLSPYHDFSKDGVYTITADITATDGTREVITENLAVKEPPNAYGINAVYGCENKENPGFSENFNVSSVHAQVLRDQTDKVVTFIDGSGNKYDVLPNPFSNTIAHQETITVRVAHKDNRCCYSETTFDLIVSPEPQIDDIPDRVSCGNGLNGTASFDISTLKNDLIGTSEDLKLELFHQDGQPVGRPLPTEISNKIPHQETLTARVTNTLTGCYSETPIRLVVSELPQANPLDNLIGCDDNGDGISAYFDTSTVEAVVLNGQNGMEVSYFDAYGNALASPLPNPYTNTSAFQETITVRVTNRATGCFDETALNLVTSSQPEIKTPAPLFTCDEGDGKGVFDMSGLDNQIIGSQSGLKISYFEENGNQLPSPLPENFQNTNPWTQRILVRVENAANALCFSETTLELQVNEKPQLALEEELVLCELEPSLQLSRTEDFDVWEWRYEDGTVLSTNGTVDLSEEGNYTLTVGKFKNGVLCSNSFPFTMHRSMPPNIEQVDFAQWSDHNYIEVEASGDGIFEYSIDGKNFQPGNLFQFVDGGVYQVSVRDVDGCGYDSREIVLLDYDQLLTPNNDGINDRWHIRGIEAYPDATVYIYDRYGKLLKTLKSPSAGWDGSYNNTLLPSNDYWFHVDLGNGRFYKNSFTLIR